MINKNILENYPFVTVWKNSGLGRVGKGTITENGYLCTIKDSLGSDQQTILPFETHYHSPQYLAKVKSVDNRNLTGMYHLCEEWSDDSEENAKTLKESLVGSELIVEPAHWADERRIYRSVYPVFEYWSDLEIEVTETEENRLR